MESQKAEKTYKRSFCNLPHTRNMYNFIPLTEKIYKIEAQRKGAKDLTSFLSSTMMSPS